MRQGIRKALKGHTNPTVDAAAKFDAPPVEIEPRQKPRIRVSQDGIIDIPHTVAVSPQDSRPLKFDTERRMLTDAAGNWFSVNDLAASRPGNAIRKWVNENYPETSVTCTANQ